MVPAPTTDSELPDTSGPTVVAAVLELPGVDVGDTVAAVARQVYEVDRTVVIGPPREGDGSWETVPSLGALALSLPPETDLVWVLHGDARPRPDALGALVAELERNDAAVVGSKVLRADDPELLESVGAATDVYGEPYTGLDEGEMDLQQYDVVRDVAFVVGVSMLVRRDLLRGLKGPDERLAPTAAGLDFSQRARIAGGRVMVAPSSEVIHEGRCGEEIPPWREQAGRMRAMLKAYRLVTLTWVIPAGFFLYLFDGLVQLLLGRPRPLTDLVRALAWNIVYLPSTLAARRAIAPLRVVGDEELFRYQVAGSVRLRERADEIDERFGSFIDEAQESGVAEPAPTAARGPVAAAALAVAAVAVASRGVWFGRLPVVGFSLPFPADPAAVLGAYAGGWNPTGLGSTQPLHPAAALAALVKFLLFGWDGSEALLVAGAMILALFGTARLLGRLGVGTAARYVAGVVAVLGPFVAVAGAAGYLPAVVGLSGLPWVVDAVLRPWPDTWRARIRRVSAMVAGMAPVAALVPLAAFAPVLVVGAGSMAGRRRWAAVARSFLPVAAGLVFAGVYLLGSSPTTVLGGGGPADLVPAATWIGLLLAAAIIAAVRGGRGAELAAWGVLVVGVSLVADRFPGTGAGVAAAAALAGSLGAAFIVGGALSGGEGLGRWRRGIHVLAVLAGLATLGAVLGAVPGGRAHLPEDVWSDALGFSAALAPPTGPDRVLLISTAGDLPGETRIGSGYDYRLLSGGGPTLDEAWLSPPRVGDRRLAAVLDQLATAEGVRPGSALAPFAVRWIVVSGDSPFTAAFTEQVDLASIPVGPDLAVFENQAVIPRVSVSAGPPWKWSYASASGPPSAQRRVRIADNADPRWGPDWRADDWANSVSAATGIATVEPDPVGRWSAWGAAVLLTVGLVGLVLPGRAKP